MLFVCYANWFYSICAFIYLDFIIIIIILFDLYWRTKKN